MVINTREVYRISGNNNCQHKSIACFGFDSGNNRFSHCPECGAVLIAEGKSDPEKEREAWKKVKEKPILDRVLRR